eukprot:gene6887-9437_t
MEALSPHRLDLVRSVIEELSKSQSDHKLGFLAVLSSYLVQVLHHNPNLTSWIKQIIVENSWIIAIHIPTYNSFNQLLAFHLFSLRELLQAGCISESYLTIIDIDAVMQLFHDSLVDAVVQFEAIQLWHEILQIPNDIKLEKLSYFMNGLSDSDKLLVNNHLLYVSEKLAVDCISQLKEYCNFTPNQDAINSITYVEGFLLQKFDSKTKLTIKDELIRGNQMSKEMIFTDSAKYSMKRLSQAVLLGIPMIVQGNIGCGKTFYIRQMARELGQEETLIEISVNDQTDSKTLIGSYVCSDVPGEFIWQSGIITQAIINGYWLVIEEIDKAPLEFIASLASIIERRTLYLPHRDEEIIAHHSFRLFGTRICNIGTTSQIAIEAKSEFYSTIYISSMKHFSHFWHFISIPEPSKQEIEIISKSSFPSLNPLIIDKVLNVYITLSQPIDEVLTRNTLSKNELTISSSIFLFDLRVRSSLRKMTLRELLKVCKRIASYELLTYNQASDYLTDSYKRNALQEIVDVLIASIRDKSVYERVLYIIAEIWNISSHEIETYFLRKQCQMEIFEKNISIGRVSIEKTENKENRLILSNQQSLGYQNYSFTQQSMRMLESIAMCVSMNEPVLLVGETGSGKTTIVQELADLVGIKLVVQNLSLSTEVNDLLGGYRPVTIKQLFAPYYEEFVQLFHDTLSSNSNAEFLQIISQLYYKQNWKKLLKAFAKASLNALKKLKSNINESIANQTGQSSNRINSLIEKWDNFMLKSQRLEVNLPKIENGFAFSYIHGVIIDAMQHGHWILLDEINLASPETLQCLTGILDTNTISMSTENQVIDNKGNKTSSLVKHPNFRVFAAMNPPSDAGKKDLPLSVRNRFTELYSEEIINEQDLSQIVTKYLEDITTTPPVNDIVSIYLQCRKQAETVLFDSANQRPRYSLRSLTRTLRAAKTFMALGFRPFNRCLFEALLVNFQTLLCEKHKLLMYNFIKNSLFKESYSKDLMFPPSRPGNKNSAQNWILVKPFWLYAGKLIPTDWSEPNENGIVKYVMTPTVENNLRELTSAIAANVAPILLQGPTSVGKTSMIEYIAARTGNKCVRINNHEHTDVQEYIGSYVTNPNSGQLEFKDGLLVEALRNGFWIILDELNLAPTEVLEALNRLLDDNKELFIPDTGEYVRPTPGFMLFATQNPPGVYGGRKILSKAFKNRFLEISVNDLPFAEIEVIIAQSCGIPPKYSKMLVKAMMELQLRRQKSSLFEGKYGAVTTRDLIKWGKRRPQSLLEVANEGYMILAEKLRSKEDKEMIKNLLNSICKSVINPAQLYISTVVNIASHSYDLSHLAKAQQLLRDGELVVEGVKGIAITKSIQRMWSLVGRCMEYNEPSLLIGDTGCGKTTICQLFAAYNRQKIRILNCHQSTETADIIGGLRPVRGKEGIYKSFCKDLVNAIDKIHEVFAASSVELDEDLIRWKNETISSSTFSYSLYEILSSHAQSDVSGIESIDSFDLKKIMDSIQSKIEKLSENRKQSPVEQSQKSVKRKKLNSNNENNKQDSKMSNDENDSMYALNKCNDQLKANWSRMKSLFEWQDGPLIVAMKEGDIFLLDEINLADDAVIERLNSVLESNREITLAEKGGEVMEKIIAHPNFKFLATMNPGGDFGKRELSPALRSRFTEIWVPNTHDVEDSKLIIVELLQLHLSNEQETAAKHINDLASKMIDFMTWINEQTKSLTLNGINITLRDIISWAKFITSWNPANVYEVYSAFVHGAHMIILDGMGIGFSSSRESIYNLKKISLEFLLSLCPDDIKHHLAEKESFFNSFRQSTSTVSSITPMEIKNSSFFVGNFSIPLGSELINMKLSSSDYILHAKNTVTNLGRIIRAMQLSRPILLEGPPGVGKSSLISNLAKLTGHKLVRINLSEHSEISDLLGTDLPAQTDEINDENDSNFDNQEPSKRISSDLPKFKWSDGVFLTAMKMGHWVLLDELNLAPQSVLEGLNACFDHREEVFIPELGTVVRCPSTFRVFCAQNPMMEGGGRKGLPQSFLSRLSRVYVEAMTEEDMEEIVVAAYSPVPPPLDLNDDSALENQLDPKIKSLHPNLTEYIPIMVKWIQQLQDDIVGNMLYGRSGSPWEFNLRDIFRWCDLLKDKSEILKLSLTGNLKKNIQFIIADTAHMLFYSRLRTVKDREFICQSFTNCFGFSLRTGNYPEITAIENKQFVVGTVALNCKKSPRLFKRNISDVRYASKSSVNRNCNLIKSVESIAQCVNQGWPSLLIGSSGTGKVYSVKYLASLTGMFVKHFCVTQSTDSTELLGSFEQFNPNRHLLDALMFIEYIVMSLTSILSSSQISTMDIVPVLSKFSKLYSQSMHLTETNSLQLPLGLDLYSQLKEFVEKLELHINSILSDIDSNTLEDFQNWIKQAFSQLKIAFCQTQSSGFEWVDGIIVKALVHGYWLIIENVNLCSASVLDRLNSLLEPHGTLLLTESGIGREIVPHKNFRVFLTMDPEFGEISRAMRNRCVELFYPKLSCDSSKKTDIIYLKAYIMDKFNDIDLTQELLNVYSVLTENKKVAVTQSCNYSLIEPLPSHLCAMTLFQRVLDVILINIGNGFDCAMALKDALSSVLPTIVIHNNEIVKCDLQTNQSYPFVSFLHKWSYIPRDIYALLSLLSAASSKSLEVVSYNDISWIREAVENSLQRSSQPNSFHLEYIAEFHKLLNVSCHSKYFNEHFVHFILLVLAAVRNPHSWTNVIIESVIKSCDMSSIYVLWTDSIDITTLNHDLQRLVLSSTSSITLLSPKLHLYQSQQSSFNISTFDQNILMLKLMDIMLISRVFTLGQELAFRKNCRKKFNAVSIRNDSLSVFEMGYAISEQLIEDMTPEIHLIQSVFELILNTDCIVKELFRFYKSLPDAKVSTVNLFRNLDAVLCYRDFLSRILMQELFSGGRLKLPWERIAIIQNWLFKSVKELYLLPELNVLHESHNLYVQLKKSSVDHERYQLSLAHYFNLPNDISKMRLWKLGGHAAIPMDVIYWPLLHRLRNFAAMFTANVPFINSQSLTLPRIVFTCTSRSRYQLIKEWLRLYSTFYWKYTNELKILNNENGMNVPSTLNIAELLQIIENKSNISIDENVDIDYEAFDDHVNINAKRASQLFSSKNVQAKIEAEMNSLCSYSQCAIIEAVVIERLEVICELVPSIILNKEVILIEQLLKLRDHCKMTIDMTLRYSSFNSVFLRELQTLLWFCESIKSHIIVAENSVEYQMNKNLLNLSSALNYSLQSTTLSSILNLAVSNEKQMDNLSIDINQQVEISRNCLIQLGPIRQLQLISFQIVMRYLDIKTIFPQYTSKNILNAINFNTATVSVISCVYAKNKLHQLFRKVVFAVNESLKTKLVNRVDENKLLDSSYIYFPNYHPQLASLKKYTIDVMLSCKDYFNANQAELFNEWLNVLSIGVNLKDDLNEKLFNLINNFDFDENVMNCSESLSNIFKTCLLRVAKLLSGKDHTNVESISEAWTCIGVVKLKLLLPTIPIDPALRPSYKAELLKTESTILTAKIQHQAMFKVFSGGELLNESIANTMDKLSNYEDKMTLLLRKGITRPVDVVPFYELHKELSDAIVSLADPNRLLNLIKRFSNLKTECLESTNKSFDNIEIALSELLDEEMNWQTSVYSFVDRYQQERYSYYEDIISPVTSALANISYGLRMLSGWTHAHIMHIHNMKTISSTKTIVKYAEDKNVNHIINVREIWRSIAQYPFSVSVSLRSNLDDFYTLDLDEFNTKNNSNISDKNETYLTVQAKKIVVDILFNHSVLLNCAKNYLSINRSENVNNNRVPSFESIDAISLHIILLHTMAKIDYFVGGNSVPASSFQHYFELILEKFVVANDRGIEQQRLKQAKVDAFYRNRKQEIVMESDDKKEEEAALKHHFPNHLQELLNIDSFTKENNLSQLNRADEDEEANMDLVDNDLIDNETDNEAHIAQDEIELFETMDENTVSRIISYHARMIFNHIQSQLVLNGSTWLRKRKGKLYFSLKEDEIVNQKYHLQHTLSHATLLSMKAFEWSIKDSIIPNLSETLKGSSLLALACVIEQTNSSKLKAHNTRQSQVDLFGKIDRDLVLLLSPAHDDIYKPISFHHDSNPTEVIKASGPLQKLYERASQLLIQFPENEFLVQVCVVCSKISQEHINISLGKMLMSIEFLLRKADEWEAYAAKHVSLSEEMLNLRRLISQWRIIELKSWESLLRCKEIEYCKKANTYWFTLSSLLRSVPPMSSSNNTSHINKPKYVWVTLTNLSPSWLLNKEFSSFNEKNSTVSEKKSNNSKIDDIGFLNNIFSILDDFLRTSSVGEFPTRLHLVRLFALQLKQKMLKDPTEFISKNTKKTGERKNKRTKYNNQIIKQSVANLVYNIWEYYQQFLSEVRSFQETLKQPIQKRLNEEVKISKWDQMNTYALIEHSEKIHRKLNKILREYQIDVLDYPIAALLQKNVIIPQSENSDGINNQIPSNNELFPTFLSHFPEFHLEEIEPEVEQVSNNGEDCDEIKSQEEKSDKKTVNTISVIQSFQTNPTWLYTKLPTIIKSVLSSESKLSTMLNNVEDIKLKFPKLFKISSLCMKIDKYIRESILPKPFDESCLNETEGVEIFNNRICFGFAAADLAESLCHSIFERIGHLKSEKVAKALKHRAVMDLLTSLRGHGISHLHNDVPNDVRHNASILSIDSPLSVEIASDLEWFQANLSSAKSTLNDHNCFEKGEKYYVRNLVELTQLRTQSQVSISKDITYRESSLMVSLSENFFYIIIQLRMSLISSINDHTKILKSFEIFSHHFQNNSNNCIVHDKTTIEDMITFQIQGSNIMLDNLIQLKYLFQVAIDASKPENIEENSLVMPNITLIEMKNAMVILDRVISSMSKIILDHNNQMMIEMQENQLSSVCFGKYDMLFNNKSNDSFESLSKYNKIIINAKKDLLSIQNILYECLSAEVVEPIFTRLNEFHSFSDKNTNDLTTAIDNSSNLVESSNAVDEKLVRLLSTCIDDCLISIQKLRSLANNSWKSSDNLEEKVQNNEDISPMVGCFGEEIDLANGLTYRPMISLTVVTMAAMNISKLAQSIDSINQHVAQAPTSSSHLFLEICHPLITRIVHIHSFLIDSIIQLYKSSNKLLYICIRVFRNLLAKGLCSDETKEDDVEGNDNTNKMTFEDNVDGTGMGEGDGLKDVSDQIENEEQLLGLKNDKPQEKKKPEKPLSKEEKDSGVEMNQDFDGEYFDIPEDEEEEEKKNKNDESEEEDSDDIDREMGDANLDDIVDEKQWDEDENDDKNEKGENSEEKFEKDSKMKGEAIEGEMRTKDEEEQEKDSKEKDKEVADEKKPSNKNKENKEDGMNHQSNEENEDNNNEDENNINQDSEDKIMEKQFGIQKRNDDDKDLDDDNNSDNNNDNNDEVDKMDEVKEEQTGDDDFGAKNPNDESGVDNDNIDKDGTGGDDLPDDMQLDDDNNDNDDNSNPSPDDKEVPVNENVNDDNQSEPDPIDNNDNNDEDNGTSNQISSSGNAGEMPEEIDKDHPEDEEEEALLDHQNSGQNDENKPAAYGVESKSGKESIMMGEKQDKQNEMDDEVNDEQSPQNNNNNAPKGQGNMSQSRGKEGTSYDVNQTNQDESQQQPPPSQQHKTEPLNPFKQKGDINKEWHRRLNLLTSEEEEEKNPTDQPNRNDNDHHEGSKSGRGLYEYVQEDENVDKMEEQILSANNNFEDETSQPPPALPSNKNESNDNANKPVSDDDNKGVDDKKRNREDEVNDSLSRKVKKPCTSDIIDRDQPGPDPHEDENNFQEDDHASEDKMDGVDDSDDISNDKTSLGTSLIDMNMNKSFTNNHNYDHFKESIVEEQLIDDGNHSEMMMDLTNNQLIVNSSELTTAKQAWLGYRNNTESYAIRLCEQLKLILEPTLAARLQGDYRM